MLVYLTTLLLSMLFCRRMQLSKNHALEHGHKPSEAKFWGLLAILVLGIVVSTRHYVGTDYGNYIDIYSISSWNSYSVLAQEPEALYLLMNRWCYLTFGDYLPVFVICGMGTVALVIYGIYRNSSLMWLSVFLFVTSMYYFDLFNGMRQMISTAIMFAAYPLLEKKRWIPLFFLTLVAHGFHASSYVILLVFLFAAYAPPRSVISLLVILAFSTCVILYGSFAEYLIDALQAAQSKYLNYEDTLTSVGYGANALRFGLTAMPVVFGWFTWPVLRRKKESVHILWNISLINSMFMLLAIRHWVFSRFSMFFGIYNVLLWPEIIKCFDRRSRLLMIAGILGVYFLYFCLIVRVDSNLLPYRSWLFGGVYG